MIVGSPRTDPTRGVMMPHTQSIVFYGDSVHDPIFAKTRENGSCPSAIKKSLGF